MLGGSSVAAQLLTYREELGCIAVIIIIIVIITVIEQVYQEATL
jgi:hypothetical protein